MRILLAIRGMRDNRSRERVVESIGRVTGVRSVVVSLFRAVAMVSFSPPCEVSAIVGAVVAAGFEVTVIGSARENGESGVGDPEPKSLGPGSA
ncbi:MAG: heavy-metal-associated domain-containing protein [Phycisphaerales bacterium JB037]